MVEVQNVQLSLYLSSFLHNIVKLNSFWREKKALSLLNTKTTQESSELCDFVFWTQSFKPNISYQTAPWKACGKRGV